ncbi:MAG TPA: MraY family glycosyltransferase [Candidatus Goldiibacteriota bacterium]|nr:MraY family glycosyltransferase [Candidatus Goldiibacteriota bacterium]
MEFALTALASFLLGLLFTPLAIWTAHRIDILDRPVTKLKKHEKPVAYLGGVAVFLAFIIPVLAFKIIMHETLHGVLAIVMGGTLMMGVGLIDDVKNLTPYAKLVMQFVVAGLILKANMHIKFMDNNIINIALTVLWIVGVSNAMNLIDIMDGLAAGVSAVACAAFFAVAFLAGRVNDMLPAAALFGAVTAFLIYNKPPARIYLGDAGSLFLGFTLAAIALNESYTRTNVVAVLSPVLILGVPIFEVILVTMIRIGKGVLPIYGTDDHAAQRLVMLGMSKPQSVLFLVCATAVLSGLAVYSTFLSLSGAIVLYLAVFAVVLMYAILLASVDMKKYHKIHRKRS